MENLEHHDGAELIVNDLIRDLNRLTFLNNLAIEKAQSEPNFAESVLLSTLRKIDDFIFTTKGLASIPKLFALSVLEMITFHKNSTITSVNNKILAIRNTYVQGSTILIRNKVILAIPKLFALSVLEMITFHKNSAISSVNNKVLAITNTYTNVTAILVRNKVLLTIPKLVAFSFLEMITFHKNVALSSISLRVNRVFASFTQALGYILRYIYSVKNSISSIKISLPTTSFKLAILRPALSIGLVLTLITSLSSVAAIADELNGDETVSVSSEETPVPEETPAMEETPTPEPTVGDEVIVEETPAIATDEEVALAPEEVPTETPSPEPTTACVTEIALNEDGTPVDPTQVLCETPLPIVVEAPTNLSYQVLVEGIKLTWEKSVSTIDKYVVTIGPENRTIDVNADLSELLLTDLNRKAAYSFSVIAVSGEIQSAVLGPLELDLATIKFPRPPMNAEVGGLIVKFNEDLTSQQVTTLADTSDLTPVSLEVSSEISTNTHLVEFNQPVNIATAQEIADSLEASNSVEFAELDFAFNTANTDDLGSVVPNDPLYATKQWSLWGNFGVGIADGPTGLAKAYQSSTGLGVTVAVIDTGFTNHPDLEGQFVSGYDFVSNNEMLSGIREENGTAVPYDGDYVDESTYGAIGWDDNPLDPGDWNSTRSSSWHGTHVAGLIAALTNNGIGIAGIAPDAKIQPIRAFSWRGGLLSDVIASITWASGGTVENVPNNQTPAKVINLSFSVEAPCTPSLQLVIDDAIARGSVVVAAAGNNSQDAADFAPGNCNNVITVGAIDADGDRANYSNFGEVIDISAPGGELDGQAIYSTSNQGSTTSTVSTYAVRQGTSVATAQVSAALSKLSQTNPTENAVQLRARVLSKESVRPFTSGACLTDENCGLGYLFFGVSSVSQFMMNNEKLRFGGGGQGATSYTFVDSINNSGMPEQPFYKAANNSWYKLTYSDIPLSFALGSGTGGSNWSGANIPASSDYIGMTSLSGMTVDVDDTTTRSPSQAVAYGYGTVTVSGTYDLNGDDVGISHKYELGANDSFIKVTTTVTNNELTTINNLRLWVGTRDDWVSTTDGPSKQRGNIVNGAFQAISNSANASSAIKIFTANEGIVFYSTTPNTSTAINSCCSFINAFGQDPTTSAISATGDGSYAITLPGGNVAAGNSVSIVWFYAAGAIDDLDDIVNSVAAAASPAAPSVSPTSGAVNLTWTEPSSSDPITGYKIRYSTDGGSTWTTSAELSTTREYDWTGLTNGTSYLFQVAALTGSTNPKTVGSYSASSTAIPGGATAPTISSITAGNQKLTVSFSAPSSTGGFPITDYEYSTNNGSTWVSSGSVTSPIIISGLTNGTTYQVKLRAKGSFAGVPSGATSGTPIATVASAPTISSITTSSKTLTVNFSAPTDNGGSSITNYKYSTDGINYIAFSPAQTSSPLTISFLSTEGGTTALIDGVSYPITIKAVNTTGDSVASNSISATPGVASSGGGSITPTPTPTPTPIQTRTPRPNNLITNPLTPIPTPSPTPVNTPTLIPGIQNGPRQLVVVPIENLINALRPNVVNLFTTPTPQPTTAGATPAPSFTNQQALDLLSNTQDKKVVELPSLVLYNNEFQPSKLVIMDNTVAQVVSPGGGLLNVEAKDGQDSVPVDNRGRVQMVRSNNVETEGTGMQPNSEFAVYLFSDPILLGIGKTDAQGKFFASFPVTQDLPIGDHTLQVNGLLPDGRATSVSLPVIVVDTIATAKNQAMPQTIFVDVNPVDNALRAVYWMLIVLAVMVFLIGASYRERFFALVRRRKDDEESVQPAL